MVRSDHWNLIEVEAIHRLAGKPFKHLYSFGSCMAEISPVPNGKLGEDEDSVYNTSWHDYSYKKIIGQIVRRKELTFAECVGLLKQVTAPESKK